MNFYKEKRWIELDPAQFKEGGLYTVENSCYKLLCCCSANKGGAVILTIVEILRGSYPYSLMRLTVQEEPDPDIRINRVILEMDHNVNKIFLREEKELLKDLADKLYQRGVITDDSEA